VRRTELKEVSKENFKMFKNLKHLEISGNLLKAIEENLFEQNPLLKYLDLHANQIMTVHADAIKSFKNLEIFFFIDNTCISFKAGTKVKIQKYLTRMNKSCSESQFDFNKLKSMKENFIKLEERFNSKNENVSMINILIFTLLIILIVSLIGLGLWVRNEIRNLRNDLSGQEIMKIRSDETNTTLAKMENQMTLKYRSPSYEEPIYGNEVIYDEVEYEKRGKVHLNFSV
jgi:hypothetical protein